MKNSGFSLHPFLSCDYSQVHIDGWIYSTMTATALDNVTLTCQVTSLSPPCSGHIWMFNSKTSTSATDTQQPRLPTLITLTSVLDRVLISHIYSSLMKQTLSACMKLVKPLLEHIYGTSSQGQHVSATMSKYKFQDLRLVCWSRRRENDSL